MSPEFPSASHEETPAADLAAHISLDALFDKTAAPQRLKIYDGVSLSQFYTMLSEIRFISCAKAHEFSGGGASECSLRPTNGRCAHQRAFKSLENRNVATLLEDALTIINALGYGGNFNDMNTGALIKTTRRRLEILDLQAARGSVQLICKNEIGELKYPVPGNAKNIHELKKYLQSQEVDAGQMMEDLTPKIVSVFAEIVHAVNSGSLTVTQNGSDRGVTPQN